jgi:hypothetical protein
VAIGNRVERPRINADFHHARDSEPLSYEVQHNSKGLKSHCFLDPVYDRFVLSTKNR